MPVKSPPRERPLLLMFLAEYENGAWKSATPDWVEERIDGKVEVVAERADGGKLAIEHTIVQPFVDANFVDSYRVPCVRILTVCSALALHFRGVICNPIFVFPGPPCP
jgi:hypothetical protein